MRWKSLFITIVLNIFLMLFASLLLEFNNLTDRFTALEDTISTSVDSALKLSVNSEEFFGVDSQALLSSHSQNTKDIANKRKLSSQIAIWNESTKSFDRINLYALANYYNTQTGTFANKFPTTKDMINSAKSILGDETNSSTHMTAKVFNWLYGGISQDYTNSSLSWSSKNTNKQSEYASISANRGANFGTSENRTQLNSNFKAWANGVGKTQYTVGILKTKAADDSSTYELSTVAYPTVANMGLDLGSYDISVEGADTVSANLNSVSSEYVNDNFVSSFKTGKSANYTNNTLSNSIYFLTPQSLGITYIPPEVLKPSILANLLNTIHLNKISGSNGWKGDASNSASADNINSAKGCISTDVYTDGGTTQQTHVLSSGEDGCIYNDGNVEYDLNSVRCKVDYFSTDFSQGITESSDSPASADNQDEAYQTLYTKLAGQLSGYTQSAGVVTSKNASAWGTADKQKELRKKTLSSFLDEDKDTATYTGYGSDEFNYADSLTDSVRTTRIVARVTTRIKVHIPYKSSILQWFCYRFKDGGSSGHYSIKLWDSKNGKVDKTNDGLWYSYTTYFMTSRS